MKIIDLLEWEDVEDWSIDDYTPYGTYQFVQDLISNGQETEITDQMINYIATDPQSAKDYACIVINRPFPVGEDAIATNASCSYSYAKLALKGKRFKKGEPVIMVGGSRYAYLYARYILKKQWPAAEPYIAKVPEDYIEYLWFIYKGKIPHTIIRKFLLDSLTVSDLTKKQYDYWVKELFPTSSLLVNKWIRFGDRLRGRINESN